MTVQIEKDIPLPEVRRGFLSKWPAADLEVGESFLIPADAMKPTIRQQFAASCTQKLKPKKFAGRTVDGGTRIWRVK